MNGGPQYESPAECLLLRLGGADALGMSTCHEVTTAVQCQMRVLGFSLITNIAQTDVKMSSILSHDEVLDAGAKASEKFCHLVTRIIKNI